MMKIQKDTGFFITHVELSVYSGVQQIMETATLMS